MKTLRALNLSALLVVTALALSPLCVEAADDADSLMHDNTILGKGDGQMLVKADRITYDTGRKIVTAEGHVEIDYNGRIVTADRVVYDDNTATATADGHVVMMAPNGDVGFSDHAVLTDKMRDGVFNAFSALIGANGRFASVRAVRTDQGTRMRATRAVFTPCKVCNKPGQRTPLWQVKAAHAVHDELTHRITYTDAIIEFFGVPIAYTPYFSQADPTVKRASGMLAPDLGSSSALGSFVRLPIYVALTDSQDFTIAPTFSTHGGELVEGEYRERWNQGGMWLQASMANNPHSGLSGNQDQTNSSLFGSGIIPINDVWHAGYDAQLTSNDTYLKLYNISQDQRLTSDLFLEGTDGRSHFEITGYFFQGLLATDVNSTIPIVAPVIQYTFIPERDVLDGEFRFDINTAAITRDLGVDSQRATAEVRWRRQVLTDNGQIFTLQADARGDIFRTTNNDLGDFPTIPVKPNYVERGLPYVGLDWRWPFISGGGEGKTSLLIEPLAELIAAPYGGNPKDIPNNDSTQLELNELNLFSFDPLPGYDVVETGSRANLGLRTEAFFPTGSVELLIGQTFRLKPDPNFTTDSALSGKSSDVVSRLAINFPPYFSMTDQVDIDPNTGTIRRNEVYADARFGRSSLELSYLRLPPSQVVPGVNSREEVNGQGTLGLWDYWVLYAEARRDLAASQMIDSEVGFGYEDECLGVSLSWRRSYTRDRNVPPSSSVLFRFNLKTDETLGQATDIFPRHIFSSTTL
jgi:LPS-assembly protein